MGRQSMEGKNNIRAFSVMGCEENRRHSYFVEKFVKKCASEQNLSKEFE